MNGLKWLWLLALICSLSLRAEQPDTAAHPLVTRYVGTWELDELLREPSVQPELRALLGDDLERLINNISVRGPVGVYGGALTVMGNAPHRGGEEEAVLCIQLVDADSEVHAAIFSGGRVTIRSRQPRYDFLPICIRDWVALVSTGHRYRMRQPDHVDMVVPGRD